MTARAVDGAGNGTEASISVAVEAQIQLHITSPVDGSAVTQSPILVRGTVTDNLPEVGITVNGFIAHTQGGQFAVEGVEVAPGSTTLTATATDGAGLIVTASATVTVPPGPPSPPVTLRADFSSSLAPAGVAFEVETFTPHPIVSYQVDFEGNGTVDFTSSTFAGVSHTYPIAGLYVPILTVTDAQGTPFTATTVVNLWDRVEIDALLQSTWAGMKEALSQGDVEKALTYFTPAAQPKYRYVFETLRPSLAVLVSDLPPIRLVDVQEGTAECFTSRIEDGVLRGYFIYFTWDASGLWKLAAL